MPPPFPMFDRPAVLIDLDDTLSDFTGGFKGWRVIGPPRPFAQDFVRIFKEYDWTTILWTARAEIGFVREWLLFNGFFTWKGDPYFDHINNNPMNALKDANPCKPLADLIIDNTMYPFCGRPIPLKETMDNLLAWGVIQWREKRWNPQCCGPSVTKLPSESFVMKQPGG